MFQLRQFLSVNLLTPVSELNITLTDRKASESFWNFYISGELWITEGKLSYTEQLGKRTFLYIMNLGVHY